MNLIKKLIIYQLVFILLASFLIPLNNIKALEPLVISQITITKTDKTATISWQTNRPAYGKIQYGLYSNDYHWQIQTNFKDSEHTMTLMGLMTETDYYFRLSAEDEFSAVTSFEQNFKTNKKDDNQAPKISEVTVAYTTGSSATIQWLTDEPATSEAEYGMTTSYGTTRSDGNLVKVHDLTLTGLIDGTYYHFRAKSKDKENNVSIWYDMTFQTKLTNKSDQDDLVIYSIKPVSENDLTVTKTTAIISWRTNKLAEGWVRYGTTTNYGKTVATNPPRDFLQSITLTGLIPNTIYYFEIEAKDVLGRHVKSERFSFKTKGEVTVSVESQVLGASTEGLLVYLPFDEGTGDITYDQSFNNNNGLLDPANPPQWTEGISGNALNFLGQKENVKVPDNDTIRFRNSLSILAWIKINGFSPYNKIATKENAYELILGPNDGILRLALYPEGAGDWIWLNSPGRPLARNTWYFVAGTYDGNLLKIYVDAQKVGESQKTIDINNSTHPLYIGGNVIDNKEWFDGLIDEVAVFDYALTADEISNIYANGLARYLKYAGIPTKGSGNQPPASNSGTILGASNIPLNDSGGIYVCNPNLGYTRFKALYKTTDSPDIWAILETGQKHYITSPASFKHYQCDWSKVKIVSQKTLASYPNANLVRTPNEPIIYHLFQRPNHKWLKINIPSPTIFVSYSNNYWGNVARVNSLDIQAYPTAQLIKTAALPDVYLIEGTAKRRFQSVEVFSRLGYDWAEVVELNQTHLDSFTNGPVID